MVYITVGWVRILNIRALLRVFLIHKYECHKYLSFISYYLCINFKKLSWYYYVKFSWVMLRRKIATMKYKNNVNNTKKLFKWVN
jgi:hypothetical protein